MAIMMKVDKMEARPIVSVCIMTYQHARYIRDCLDGVMMQRTQFPFEVILGEDESSDGTRQICMDYARRYPAHIRLFLRSRKDVIRVHGIETGRFNLMENLKAAKGKYIALCEGDDYWTDPDKLQKQVEFLEANPDYVFCCHNSQVRYEDGKPAHPAKTRIWDSLTASELILNYNDFNRDFLVCPAHTSSLLFKNDLIREFPGWFSQGVSADLPLMILLMQYGKAKFINACMSVYRIHPSGVSSSRMHQGVSLQRGRIHMYENLLMTMDSSFAPAFREIICRYYIQRGKIERATLKKAISDISEASIPVKSFDLTNLLKVRNYLNDTVSHYIHSMKVGAEPGVYRYAAVTTMPNLYASTYACMTLSLLGRIDRLSSAEKKQWLNYFDQFQNPDDGLFYDSAIRNNLFDQTDWWGARHLAVQIAYCYAILGGRPPHPFHWVKQYYNLSVFERFLESIDFDNHDSDIDNRIMNIGVLLQYNRDMFEDLSAANAVSFLQQWLLGRLNPQTGLWGRIAPQTPATLSRSIQFYYHLYLLFEYDNIDLPSIEKVIDYTLTTQNANGGFGVKLNSSACEDIDSMDILMRYARRVNYRNKDILLSLMRGFQWVLSNFDKKGGAFFRKNEAFRYGHPEMSTPPGVPSMFAAWFRTLNLAYLMHYFADIFNYNDVDMTKTMIHAPGYTFLKRNLSWKRNRQPDETEMESYFRIFTHLTKEELLKLREIAASKKKGVFVEIGSYLGASSNFLAMGCRDNSSVLYCVDTWQNHSMSEGPRDTYQEFCSNTKQLSPYIIPLRGFSARVAEQFDQAIDILFLDGDHDYDGVKSDWDSWKSKLAEDAIVVFHDWGWAQGVQRVIKEEVAPYVKCSGSLPNLWWGCLTGNMTTVKTQAQIPLIECQPVKHDDLIISQHNKYDAISYSVVIPTRNRATSLEQTLYSLCSIQDPGCPYEVILVDNGSTDTTRQVTELFKQALPQLKYVFEPNPGLHNGRHRGALEARGQYICYLDDDVKVDPLWLRSVVETFETTDAVLVGGKILPEYEQTPPDWLKEFVKPVGNYGYNVGQLTLIDLGEQIREIDPIYVWGANFSIRKDVLFKCGGFRPDSMPKELLDFRGDGETSLSRAIKQKGYKAFYHPRAMVRHCISKDRLTVEYFCTRMFNQGISDSFTEIRNAGKLPNPVVSTVLEAYQNGKIHHRRMVQNNPDLLSWITRKDYFSECQSKTPASATQPQQIIENKTVQMIAKD